MMKENTFWHTKEGGLTLAFIVIMAAFIVMMLGLTAGNEMVCLISFIVIVAAMLYSPLNTFVIAKLRNKKGDA